MIPIVTINFNGSNDTIELINSLIESEESFNLIIVDNNSSNQNEFGIIKEALLKRKASLEENTSHYEDERITKIVNFTIDNNIFTLIQSNDNYGFSVGTNIGLKYALFRWPNCRYLCILNNDTIVTKYFLSNITTILDKEEIGAAMGTIIHYGYNKPYIWSIGGYIDYLRATGVHQNQGDIFGGSKNKFVFRSFISGCFTVFKRSVLERIGFLDEDYFFGTEEFQYSKDICKFTKIAWIPGSLIYHKVKMEDGHGSSHIVKKIEWQFNSYMNKVVFINKNCNIFYRILWRLLFRCYFISNRKKHFISYTDLEYKILKKSVFANLNKKLMTKQMFHDFQNLIEKK